MVDAGAVLESRAREAYLDRDFVLATEMWEQAYAAYRSDSDNLGAVRSARTLGYLHGAIMRDLAVMSGWVARASTLLGDEDSCEAGWVALTMGMFAGDRQLKERRLAEAVAIARRFGDAELELSAKAYLGASMVHGDRVDEGMALLDEALAGVAGHDVEDFFVLSDVFCQMFVACERAHDIERADQWIRVGESIAERRNLPVVSAFCRTHYGGLLTAAGRWPEADAALTEAVRLWNLGFRPLRPDAQIRLAALRVKQGRIEEASVLLDGVEVDAESALPLAAVHMANGDLGLARDVLERAIDDVGVGSSTGGPLLAELVDVHLAAGRTALAAATADRLTACAEQHPSPYLSAVAALARGRLGCVTDATDVRDCLRGALRGFAKAQLPMELARTHLLLAEALAEEDPDVARAEARIALDAFYQLDAPRHVDAAAAVLRRLGVRAAPAKRSSGILTKREAEILDLLSAGLTNPEIAARLFISRKTVEHHVGNILAKLGLRGRAEAAAYAAREKQAAK